eukprot:5129822-Alexandrium_andersonii.AAC.1
MAFAGLRWAALGRAGPCWAVLGRAGPCWLCWAVLAVLGCPGVVWLPRGPNAQHVMYGSVRFLQVIQTG